MHVYVCMHLTARGCARWLCWWTSEEKNRLTYCTAQNHGPAVMEQPSRSQAVVKCSYRGLARNEFDDGASKEGMYLTIQLVSICHMERMLESL